MTADRRSGPPTTTRYEPGSPLRHPRKFAAEVASSLAHSWDLAFRLFQRDLRARYRQSALKYVWLVIPPLAMALTWILLNRGNVIDPGDIGASYPAFVLTGSVLWQGFAESIASPIRQLQGSTALLTKVSFPSESLLLAGALDIVFQSVVRLVAIAPLLALYGVGWSWTLLLVPVGLLAILGFGWGLGLLLAPFGLLYQDVERTIVVVVAFWFLVSPVAYVQPADGALGTLHRLNPLTSLLSTARDWMLGTRAVPGLGWLALLVVDLLMIVCGFGLYRLALPHLVDRMQS